MSGFLAIDRYSPVLVLLLGLLTFAAALGVGASILRLLRCNFPAPWGPVAAVLVGAQALGLVVQVLAIAGHASLAALLAAFGAFVALGLAALAVGWRRTGGGFARRPSVYTVPALIASAIGLLVAMAPSSRIDELYYHMLVPARIVTDGGLRAYFEPWPAAILPQMAFQIALTPLHALGHPDAGNVLGWLFGATLAWFAWCLLRKGGASHAWAGLWSAALLAGHYTVTLHPASGSHAIGNLAMAGAVVTFFHRRELVEVLGATRFCALASLLACCAASAKITSLPMAAAIQVFSCAGAMRTGNIRGATLAAAAAPWCVFYLPLVLWTWLNTGSMLGLMAARDASGFAELVQGSLAMNRAADELIPRIAGWSVPVWAGAAGAILYSGWDLRTRLLASGFVALQAILVVVALPHDIRFLSGLPAGLAIAFAMRPRLASAHSARRILAGLAWTTIVLAMLFQALYATTFAAVGVGRESAESFARRMVPFFDDYRRLDAVLPRDAVLLVFDFRTSAVHAPRPIFMDTRDVPAGRPVYLMVSAENAVQPIPGFRSGGVVYRNPHARSAVYRAPGRSPKVEEMRVIRLERL